MRSLKTFLLSTSKKINVFQKQKVNILSSRKLSVKSATVARFSSHGQPEDVLKLETVALPEKLQPNEVLVKMVAAPINPADLNIVEGTYGSISGVKSKVSFPVVGGNEGVGVVVEAGSEVKNLKINDRVIPGKSGMGTWRTYGVFKSDELRTVPNDIELEYLASISVNPATAYRLINDFAKLKEGDVIIQNGANSMVGFSVIQLAKARNIKTVNIIRPRPKEGETIERLKGLGGHIVVTDEYLQNNPVKFKQLLSDIPKPKLALNCVGGETVTEMSRLLDNNGVLVTYGGMSRKPVTIPTRLFIFNNIQLRGFWMTRWYHESSEAEKVEMFNELYKQVRANNLKYWAETWDFSALKDAVVRSKTPYKERKVILKMN